MPASSSECKNESIQTYDEIENSSEAGYRKMLLFKIIKKVEYLLDLYEEKYIGEVQIKLLKIQFYSIHLCNKIKIKHIISNIEYSKLSLINKFLVFDVNERANEMISE